MSAEFTHLVLTRFNTAVAYGYTSSWMGLDTAWLKARLRLFEQFCLPSMLGQHGAQFRWIVFLDAASPDWLREKIHSYGSVMTPLYIDGPATNEALASSVGNAGLITAPYLVTTRLDNDDAIGRHHLASVQQAFRGQDREFVAFPFGLQWFRGHLYDTCWPANPFLSLVERVREGNRFTTVFCVSHDKVRNSGKVKHLIRSPQWLQVIHSSNILNGLRGRPRVKSRSHSNFDVLWPEEAAGDSLLKRIGFSTSAYGGRANRLVQKTIALLT